MAESTHLALPLLDVAVGCSFDYYFESVLGVAAGRNVANRAGELFESG